MAILYFITLPTHDKYDTALLALKYYCTHNVWVINAVSFNKIHVNLKKQEDLASKWITREYEAMAY